MHAVFYAMVWITLGGCVRASGGDGKDCTNDLECGAGLVCAYSVDGDPDHGSCRREDHGGLGGSCDTTTGAPCSYLCVILSSGQGMCTEPCQAEPDNCPSGFQCGPLAGAEPGDSPVCLPNQSCGNLSYQGECQGSLLTYCGDRGPVSFDCATRQSDDGTPLRCALVNEEHGYDCVSEDFGAGCGDIPLEGICTDNTVFYCQSLESGTVGQTICQPNEECAIDQDGFARCRTIGTEGCGSVTYEGYCEGDVAYWCEDDEIKNNNCGPSQTCGFVDNETGYWCVDRGGEDPPPTGDTTLSGTFTFERPRLTTNGLGTTETKPVRYALVQARRSSDDQLLDSRYTQADGSFQLSFDGDDAAYVLVWATHNSEDYKLAVRDCPTLQNCAGNDGAQGNAYAAGTDPITGSRDFGTLTIPQEGVAGAFNIFDVMISGTDFAKANFGRTPPLVTAQWKKGSNTFCNTSCYSPRDNSLFIISTNQDTDEFDDPVLGHEFGHFLEANFSRSDSPGGAHDGSPTDPRLAWGEGYGTFIGSAIFGSSVYIDTFSSGTSVFDINNTGQRADLSSSRGMEQLVSEFMVAELLWHTANGGPGVGSQGYGPIFSVLGIYLPSTSRNNRGVSGVDLVDFLDGWFCLGNGARSDMEQNVNQNHGFPYDYNGPSNCR